MREMVLHKYCDHCHDEFDRKIDADTEVLVTVPGRGLRRIDLCEVSDKRLAQPLRDLQQRMAEAGNQPALPAMPAAAGGDERTCPIPGCSSGPFVNRSGTLNHLWTMHINPPHGDRPKIDACPDCGQTAFASNTGLAAHRRAKHGHDAFAEAVKLATDAETSRAMQR